MHRCRCSFCCEDTYTGNANKDQDTSRLTHDWLGITDISQLSARDRDVSFIFLGGRGRFFFPKISFKRRSRCVCLQVFRAQKKRFTGAWFCVTLLVAYFLRSKSFGVVSLRTVRIVPRLVSDVWRELEARYDWNTAPAKIFLDSAEVEGSSQLCERARR